MDNCKASGGVRVGEELELDDVHAEGDGFGPLVKYCESNSVPVPVFFDPITGEIKSRPQDVRGSDYFQIGTSIWHSTLELVFAPACFESASKLYQKERDRRRDIQSEMIRLKDCLNHVASTWKFTGDGNDPDTKVALQEACDLLDELGETVYDDEEQD